MRKISAFIGLFAVLSFSTAATHKEQDEDKTKLAGLFYQAEIARAFQEFLSSRKSTYRRCSLDRFDVSCLYIRLSKHNASTILTNAIASANKFLGQYASKEASENVASYYKTFLTRIDAGGDNNFPDTTKVFSSPIDENEASENVTMFYAPKKVGFVPFGAYDGKIPSEEEHLSALQSDSKHVEIEDVEISTDQAFAEMARKKDDYFMDAFFDYAYSDDVVRGHDIEQFWNKFADFANSMDFSVCRDGCFVALRKTNPYTGEKSISYCTVTYVAGVTGAPEDCEDIVVYAFGRTLLRSAFILNDLWGRDGEGGDELSCDWKATEAPPANSLAQTISQKLNELSNGTSYMQEVRQDEGSTTLLLANRFGTSAFFPQQYEISTIRILLQNGGKGVTAVVSPTVVISKQKSSDQQDYHLISTKEAVQVRNQLKSLIDPLNCRIVRGM